MMPLQALADLQRLNFHLVHGLTTRLAYLLLAAGALVGVGALVVARIWVVTSWCTPEKFSSLRAQRNGLFALQ